MTFTFKHTSVAGEATREFNLGLSTSPGAPTVVLMVKHAGEANRGYWNAIFKRIASRSGRTAGKITPEQVVANRSELAEIYARHVLDDWKNVTDNGQPVEFSAD